MKVKKDVINNVEQFYKEIQKVIDYCMLSIQASSAKGMLGSIIEYDGDDSITISLSDYALVAEILTKISISISRSLEKDKEFK